MQRRILLLIYLMQGITQDMLRPHMAHICARVAALGPLLPAAQHRLDVARHAVQNEFDKLLLSTDSASRPFTMALATFHQVAHAIAVAREQRGPDHVD